jgi:hypothetical protein
VIKQSVLQTIIDGVLSIPSAVIHTVIFAAWFVFGWNVGLLTNLVSLESIYLVIFIGIKQHAHHKAMKRHIELATTDDIILREIQRLHERISFINRPRLEAKENNATVAK